MEIIVSTIVIVFIMFIFVVGYGDKGGGDGDEGGGGGDEGGGGSCGDGGGDC